MKVKVMVKCLWGNVVAVVLSCSGLLYCLLWQLVYCAKQTDTGGSCVPNNYSVFALRVGVYSTQGKVSRGYKLSDIIACTQIFWQNRGEQGSLSPGSRERIWCIMNWVKNEFGLYRTVCAFVSVCATATGILLFYFQINWCFLWIWDCVL